MPLTSLYVDMNAYFASVEQHLIPALRGLPIAICPVVTGSACCIAASYEAKASGVKTGMRVSDAREACPKLVLVEARPKQYVLVHYKVKEAVESCCPIAHVCSIDEFACRLLGAEKAPAPATAIAQEIKRAIRKQVGPTMRCSIGIGPNRFLAKVAADMKKPDGLTLIEPHTLPHALHHLPLTDLPGIGENMEIRLHKAGITSVEQLCSKSRLEMISAWGSIVGAAMWHNLRGDDLPMPLTQRGSIGHQHVLAPELRTRAGVRAVLVKLIHRAAERARTTGYTPEFCTVQVAYLDIPGWHRRLYLAGRGGTTAILSAFAPAWRTAPNGKPVQAGVVLHDLANPVSTTLPLFPGHAREASLGRAMDAINGRYGPDSIYSASMMPALDSAPVRISYTQIPTLESFGEVGDAPPGIG